jgi:hypothetical protein
VVDLEQGQLLAQASLVLAQRVDATTNGGDMLTEVQMQPLYKGRVDLPAAGRSHLLNSRLHTADHPVAHPHQAPTACGLKHLDIE